MTAPELSHTCTRQPGGPVKMTHAACLARQAMAVKRLRRSPQDPNWLKCKDCPDACTTAAKPEEAQAMAETKPSPAPPPAAEPLQDKAPKPPLCPRCHKHPVKMRADGRSMGRCDQCLQNDHQLMRASRRAKMDARRALANAKPGPVPPPAGNYAPPAAAPLPDLAPPAGPPSLNCLGQALCASCERLRDQARLSLNDSLRSTIIETVTLIEILAGLGLVPGYGPTPKEPTA